MTSNSCSGAQPYLLLVSDVHLSCVVGGVLQGDALCFLQKGKKGKLIMTQSQTPAFVYPSVCVRVRVPVL